MPEEADATQPDRAPRFAALVMPCLPRLYAMARRLAGVEAEDLVQETLLRGYRASGQLHDETATAPWLRAILLNVFRDRLRSAHRQPDEVSMDDVDGFSLYRHIAAEDPFPYSDTLHLDFMGLFGREDVRAVLGGLSSIYRAPLVLRYVDSYSTKEIARLLGLPLGTVLARLHRGRKLFERSLWEYAESEGLLKKEAMSR
jgi:RNA polymerase sigma-70 factor (ECF subfamily)